MKLIEILKEIGKTSKIPGTEEHVNIGFPYKRVTGTADIAQFEFDTSPDVELSKFENKIKKEVLDKLRAAGYNTLKSVLTAEKEELLRRADMDRKTYSDVIKVLQKEKSKLGNEYRVWVQREESDGIQAGWILRIAFAVQEDAPAEEDTLDDQPSKSLSFEKEVNDPKNIYKVMNTVVNITREEIARLENAGQKVIRIEFEPTKRQIRDKSGIKMDDPNDTRRANLYLAYLKKEFPGSEIKSTANKGRIWVDIL